MAIVESIRQTIAPVHREGYPFLAGAGGIALITLFLGWGWVFWPLAILTLWVAYFFRDPARATPLREGLVVSPADGKVSMITHAVPPPELGLPAKAMPRISVFMSVFDCHINRAPVSGRITKIAYKPGLFINADLDKASEDNERNGLVIESNGQVFGVVQIAGLVARRILCWSREGETIGVGERFGMIRFGSRVDVYLPDGARPLVAEGQTAVAGETVLADLSGAEAPRSFRMG